MQTPFVSNFYCLLAMYWAAIRQCGPWRDVNEHTVAAISLRFVFQPYFWLHRFGLSMGGISFGTAGNYYYPPDNGIAANAASLESETVVSAENGAIRLTFSLAAN